MLTVVSALIALQAKPPPQFDRAIAAFRARKSFAVTIGLDARLNGQVTKERYKLSYLAPSKVLLTKLKGTQPSLYFWMNGAKFLAYDPSAKEMVVRTAGTTGPIVNRLANVMGGVEDPVAAQLQPDTMAAFIGPFRALMGWTAARGSGTTRLIRLSKNGNKSNRTEFEFDNRSNLLTRALIEGPGSKLEWDFAYHPAPRSLSFTPPSGTRKVEALGSHVRIDTADAKAKNIVDRCIRAYGRINSIAFSVNGGKGSSTNWMNGSSFRSKQSYLDWSYHNGTLTINDIARKRSYRGKCKRTQVTSYLRTLQRPMDTVLQGLMMKKNPIYNWFTTGAKISSKGMVKFGNVTADALELRSNELEVSLLVRRDNSLVASVSSRSLSDGSVISSSGREFTYWSVNKALPADTFTIRVSNPLSLSRIGMK